MMKQTTLSAGGFDRYTKQTRRAAFLAEMNRVVPWKELCELIEPFYPKAGCSRRGASDEWKIGRNDMGNTPRKGNPRPVSTFTSD